MYKLEDLSEDDFEEMVNTLCQKNLGAGVVSFTKGRDGGRDGRFEGTADSYPSKSTPWQGKFIIQAKHTTNPIASCSDNDFFGNTTSIINKEIDKIKRLKKDGEIDNYLLFTNRKETTKREKARDYIRKQTGLQNVDIIGILTLETWLKQHQDVAKQYKIGQYQVPFDFYDVDIKEVIVFFNQERPKLKNIRTLTDIDFHTISKEEKNKLNGLTQAYYDNQIRSKSMEYFGQIDSFLSNPINEEYAEMYESFHIELSNIIQIKRDTFDKFEDVFSYVYNEVFNRNKDEVRKYRSLIWVFLHHLYFNCSIGVKE